jgi:hypothetical protein
VVINRTSIYFQSLSLISPSPLPSQFLVITTSKYVPKMKTRKLKETNRLRIFFASIYSLGFNGTRKISLKRKGNTPAYYQSYRGVHGNETASALPLTGGWAPRAKGSRVTGEKAVRAGWAREWGVRLATDFRWAELCGNGGGAGPTGSDSISYFFSC